MQFTWTWQDGADDDIVSNTIQTIVKRCDNLAKVRGLYNPYLYLNYAAGFQDPIGSYGADVVKKMLAFRNGYDPFHVYERLQPDGFKIPMS